MSEYKPVCTAKELESIDDAECVAGYLAGLADEPEPRNDKSRSYWHGWRNGMMDKGRLAIDEPARNLVAEVVSKHRADPLNAMVWQFVDHSTEIH